MKLVDSLLETRFGGQDYAAANCMGVSIRYIVKLVNRYPADSWRSATKKTSYKLKITIII